MFKETRISLERKKGKKMCIRGAVQILFIKYIQKLHIFSQKMNSFQTIKYCIYNKKAFYTRILKMFIT